MRTQTLPMYLQIAKVSWPIPVQETLVGGDPETTQTERKLKSLSDCERSLAEAELNR